MTNSQNRTSFHIDIPTRDRVIEIADELGILKKKQVTYIRMTVDLLEIPEVFAFAKEWVEENLNGKE